MFHNKYTVLLSCEFWGVHSSMSEDYRLLECDAASRFVPDLPKDCRIFKLKNSSYYPRRNFVVCLFLEAEVTTALQNIGNNTISDEAPNP